MDKKTLKEKLSLLESLSKDEKAYLLALIESKTYGLVWENKPEDVEIRLQNELPVFNEITKRQILSKNLPNTQLFEPKTNIPNHILIEGDNLHALTALSFTHQNAIDVIYIDPPYNTGNKDFRYNDKFIDREDSFRHSAWLSFMQKRLKIAKELLHEKGVIFISIDDNEQAQLKLLCDEIFGESNLVGMWNWYKSATPPNLSHKIKKNIEYVLGYEKNRTNIKYKGIKKESKSDDPMTKPQNTVKKLIFPPRSINFKTQTKVFEKGIYGTDKFPNALLNDLIIENYTNSNEVTFENRFVWTQEKLNIELDNQTKINCSDSLVLSYKKQSYSEEVPPNLIDFSVGVDTTEEAGKSLLEIFGEKKFDYPKPVSLIKYLLSFKPNSKILDFFAGSGTTLHAVMQLNAQDGGNRQCILVTNNENNICEEVTYIRNKKVIEGYENSKGERVAGLIENNLRYYVCDFVGRENTEENNRLLTAQSTDLLKIRENCYEDETEKWAFEPSECQVFGNSEGKILIIVYHSRNKTEIVERLIAEIGKQHFSQKIRLYAFDAHQESLASDFEDVAEKVECVPLPSAIRNAYLQLLANL